jgi:hypothetical protein
VANPYAAQPDYAFWRRSVANLDADSVDPVVGAPFAIARTDKIATTGSCFAQHISNTLVREGFEYFVTERGPLSPSADDEGFGVFPARFGNIYSTRQFLQLFERAYGLFEPKDKAWIRKDGAFIDPFRPRIQSRGYPTLQALEEDRAAHLGAVRAMFEQCDVMIFTLGLTETWVSEIDGAAFPIAPGVEGEVDDPQAYGFRNLSVAEMVDDLLTLVGHVRAMNPAMRLILTVSPVPLIATYEPRHVLVSTTYSKSALRVTAEMAAAGASDIAYFPSYEIITGAYAKSRYFAEDLREVTPEGVAKVMSLFKQHYLEGPGGTVSVRASTSPSAPRKAPDPAPSPDFVKGMREMQGIICDEEILDPTGARA